MSDARPVDCRFRLQDEGKPYPRSSCSGCGRTITTGLGKSCVVEADALNRVEGWKTRAAAAEAEVARLREALEPLERHVALECYDRLIEGGWEKSERLGQLLDAARAALQGEPGGGNG